jgi:hypothetical protein
MNQRTLAIYLLVASAICLVLSVALFFRGAVWAPFGILGLAVSGFLTMLARRIGGVTRR